MEDFPLAAMFRQSPLNSIWEGSGNVIALDILRAAKSLPLLLTDIKQAYGQDSVFDGYVDNLERMLKSVCSDPLSVNSQKSGRLLADQLATAMQGSILIRFGDNKKVSVVNYTELIFFSQTFFCFVIFEVRVCTYNQSICLSFFLIII